MNPSLYSSQIRHFHIYPEYGGDYQMVTFSSPRQGMCVPVAVLVVFRYFGMGSNKYAEALVGKYREVWSDPDW